MELIRLTGHDRIQTALIWEHLLSLDLNLFIELADTLTGLAGGELVIERARSLLSDFGDGFFA